MGISSLNMQRRQIMNVLLLDGLYPNVKSKGAIDQSVIFGQSSGKVASHY